MEIDKNSEILVTGGNGFLGSHVCDILKEKGYDVIAPRSFEYNLTKESHVQALFSELGPFDVVINLAAKVGGIGFNKANQGMIFYDNLMINTLVQEYARRNNVKKFVGIGSVCEYPKMTPVPFKEETLWDGYPEETNASHGLTKRMALEQSLAYHDQYGFNSVHLLIGNLYGPKDNFNPQNSHVVPATIKRIVDAKKNNLPEIIMWGTGSASREFIYVGDAAEAIVLATEIHSLPYPINIGSGMEITIRDLTNKIAALVGYTGKINWDSSKPDGQPRRCLDISKSEKELGFKARTDFDIGLRNTIDWYIKNKD